MNDVDGTLSAKPITDSIRLKTAQENQKNEYSSKYWHATIKILIFQHNVIFTTMVIACSFHFWKRNTPWFWSLCMGSSDSNTYCVAGFYLLTNQVSNIYARWVLHVDSLTVLQFVFLQQFGYLSSALNLFSFHTIFLSEELTLSFQHNNNRRPFPMMPSSNGWCLSSEVRWWKHYLLFNVSKLVSTSLSRLYEPQLLMRIWTCAG